MFSISKLFSGKSAAAQHLPNKSEKENTPSPTVSEQNGGKEASVKADMALSYLCPSNTEARHNIKLKLSEIKDNTYKTPYLRNEETIEKILDSIDYKNAQSHLKNIKTLAILDFPTYYINNFVDNGYISSDKGLTAFQNAKTIFSTFSRNNTLSDFCIAVSKLSLQDWEIIWKRGIIHLPQSLSPEDYKDLASLSDEEYTKTINHPHFGKGHTYFSDNEDINSVFPEMQEQGAKFAKKLEKIIREYCGNDKTKIKELSEMLRKNFKEEYFQNAFKYNFLHKESTPEQFKFFIENIPEFHKLVHEKIKDFDDNNFFTNFSKISMLITPDNYDIVKRVLDIDISQNYLYLFTSMTKDAETRNKLNDIISKIETGELTKDYLLPFSNAQINPDNSGATKEYQDFSENEEFDKVLKSTTHGEVCFIGNKTYINHKGEMKELSLSKETFKKLFPSSNSSISMLQNDNISDCYFISSILYSLNRNKDTRYYLLKMFKESGNNITITIPAFKNNPVTFKNAELNPNLPHINSCLGNQLLEEAFLKVKSDSDKKTDFYTTGGKEYLTLKEFLPNSASSEYVFDEYYLEKGQKLYTKDSMIEKLNALSEEKGKILCASTKAREAGELHEKGLFQRHAYAINSIDKDNKTITLVNPSNTLYTTTISYDTFFNKFASVSECILN